MFLIIVPGLSFEVAARGTVGYRQRMAAATAKNLEHVRAEIARACRDAGRDPAGVTLIAVSKTFTADAIEPAIDRGPTCVRRKSRAGGERKMARVACETPGHRVASHRSAAIEQGERSGRAVRRDSFCRSGQSLRGARERDWQTATATDSVRRDQYRRRAAKGRRPAAGCGCISGERVATITV